MARLSLLIVALALLLSPVRSFGFDPRVVDIIAYRLGMTEAEVTATAERQGFHDAAFRRIEAPCPDTPARPCLIGIEARTKDGGLRFGFSTTTPPVVERIVYTFDARKPNEPEALERAVLSRFGPPTTTGPMTWCDRRTGFGPCSPDAPRLVFEAGPGSSRILTLSLR